MRGSGQPAVRECTPASRSSRRQSCAGPLGRDERSRTTSRLASWSRQEVPPQWQWLVRCLSGSCPALSPAYGAAEDQGAASSGGDSWLRRPHPPTASAAKGCAKPWIRSANTAPQVWPADLSRHSPWGPLDLRPLLLVRSLAAWEALARARASAWRRRHRHGPTASTGKASPRGATAVSNGDACTA